MTTVAATNYQQPQAANANYQQAYYNQMAMPTANGHQQGHAYMHQQQQQQHTVFGANKVAPLASMQPNMMPFMHAQQAAYDPNMLMQQMSKNEIPAF